MYGVFESFCLEQIRFSHFPAGYQTESILYVDLISSS